MAKRPNIIIFNPDQFRASALAHMGNPAAVTPNLDRTAAEDGVSFRNAFCQNTVCTPSRCSFMSGWYPHTNGHRTMTHMMHAHEPVLLQSLKEQGYYVMWSGKNDLIPGKKPEIINTYCHERHFIGPNCDKSGTPLIGDDWRGAKDGDNFFSFYQGRLEDVCNVKTGEIQSGDQTCVDHALRLIESGSEQPFCIYLPLFYPHPPYGVEEPFFSMIDRDKVEDIIPVPGDDWKGKPSILKGLYEGQQMKGWDEKRLKELRAVYHGMCSRIDDQYGQIVNALKKAGSYDDTAIFFFSDHGDFTGDYGLVEKTQNTFEDCLSNVPFIIKPPKNVPVKARISDALVELVDFPETVRAMTGIDLNYTQFGKSLLPVLAGETDEHRDAAFCEGGRRPGEIHCMERKPGTVDPGGLYAPRQFLQTSDDGPYHYKAVMCRTHEFKYTRRLHESDELYNLKKDPQELHNVVDDPAYTDILAQLKDRMMTFFMETGDVVPWKTDQR